MQAGIPAEQILTETHSYDTIGLRPRTWYSLGFDYSIGTGDTSPTPNLLTTTFQTKLGGELVQLVRAGVIPPTYPLKVPISQQTQTFSVGPHLADRHFKAVTLFSRPDLGAMREAATPLPFVAVGAGRTPRYQRA